MRNLEIIRESLRNDLFFAKFHCVQEWMLSSLTHYKCLNLVYKEYLRFPHVGSFHHGTCIFVGDDFE